MMTLQILQWNSNSLVAHQSQLKKFLTEMEKRPDIICIQETFLRPKKIVNKQEVDLVFSFPGYSVVRRDRVSDTQGGGVATLIKEGISYTTLNTVNDIEALSVQINLASKQKLTITNIYHPPETQIDPSIFKKLFELKYSIILGDFNSFSSLC